MEEKNKKIRLSQSEKIGLISNLYTMLSAGIPILEAVSNLLEDTKGNQKKLLETLREDLTQGRQVHYSFAKFPRVFDKVTVNVIKAAETAGTLDTTLKDLRENIRKQNEFNDKIKSALLYPAFIIVVFILVIFVNLIFVIPKIATVFKSLKVALPLPTKILIFISDLMVNNTIPFVLVIVAIILIFVYLFTQKRNWVLNIFFSLPVINGVVRMVDVTQFTRSLHLLLSSGISIIAALELTEDVVIRSATKKIIEKSKEMILAGKTFSEGLRSGKGYIPIIMIKLVETGERTGTLDKSLSDISEYFDYEVTNSLKTLTALIEPVMLVFVGILVGGMMISIIAPIYGLISQVGSVR